MPRERGVRSTRVWCLLTLVGILQMITRIRVV